MVELSRYEAAMDAGSLSHRACAPKRVRIGSQAAPASAATLVSASAITQLGAATVTAPPPLHDRCSRGSNMLPIGCASRPSCTARGADVAIAPQRSSATCTSPSRRRRWIGCGKGPKRRRSPPALTTPSVPPPFLNAWIATSTANPFAMPPRSSNIGRSRKTLRSGIRKMLRHTPHRSDESAEPGSRPSLTSRGATVISNRPALSWAMRTARRRTAQVQGCTVCGVRHASRFTRERSLCGSWKLIRRSTRSTHANAASTQCCTLASGPEAETCTSVPIAGRRRDDSTQDGLVEEKKPLDSIGQMAGRQGRAADVGNIAVDPQRTLDRLADELVPPIQIAHLGAVGFQVLDDLELAYAAVDVDPQRVGDEFMLADHLVDDEPADHLSLGNRLPHLLPRAAPRHPRELVDLLHLLRCELHRFRDVLVSSREDQRPCLVYAHVFGGDALRRNRVNCRRRQPAQIQAHTRFSIRQAAFR